MKINNEKELLRAVSIQKTMTIERHRHKEAFQNDSLYEGHWNIINQNIKRAISAGTGGVSLFLKWDDLASEHQKSFIHRFKEAHQSVDGNSRFR